MKTSFLVAALALAAGCGGTSDIGQAVAAIGDSGGVHGITFSNANATPGQFVSLKFDTDTFTGTLCLTDLCATVLDVSGTQDYTKRYRPGRQKQGKVTIIKEPIKLVRDWPTPPTVSCDKLSPRLLNKPIGVPTPLHATLTDGDALTLAVDDLCKDEDVSSYTMTGGLVVGEGDDSGPIL